VTALPAAVPTLVVCAWIERDGQVLLSQRPLKKHLASLWEFPGGKVEAGESLSVALTRELREELGIAARIGAEIARTRYTYPTKTIELVLMRVSEFIGEPQLLEVAALEWVSRDWFADHLVLMPPADAPLVAAALAR
jgi:8-oxo-dGTP diphosphatase